MGHAGESPLAPLTKGGWGDKSADRDCGRPSVPGFGLPADGLVFLAEEEIFGERRHRRRSRPRPVADYLTGLGQLAAGDYVVHTDHGIARYHGLQHLSVADTTGDYLHLEYTGGDKLYVPVERINLVQKYAGADGKEPVLDRLGGQAWERVKRKTREAIQAMARELLEIHAVRESVQRPALATYSGDYEEFVARSRLKKPAASGPP